jgi:hypothetical protein
VSGEVGKLIGEAEDWVEEAVGEVEHIVKPRPGGKIDTARRMAEQHSDKDLPVAITDYLIKGKPVAVDVLQPALGVAITVTLNSANPVLQALPKDTTRRGAVLIAIDNPVYVATKQNVATEAEGSATSTLAGYLPVGVPVSVPFTDAVWISATTTASQSRVTVLAGSTGA